MPQIRHTALALLLTSGVLFAQNPAPSDQETVALLVQQVKALQQETAELREKVKVLEAGRTDAAAPPVDSNASPAKPLQESAQVPQEASSDDTRGLDARLHDVRGIQWRGFGEADYKVLDQRRPELGTYGFVPGSSGNFFTGDFELFLTSQLTDRTSVLGELVFEEGDAQSYKLDLRRVLLKYERNDHMKISLGRYQTGIGYYNWAFRSAAWLQTTADRPLVMEYASNGGLLPTQAVGVSVTGLIPSGKLGLNYLGEYGSSDTIRPDLNGSGQLNDENNSNHVLVGLFARPDAFPGLQVGASAYHDKISDSVAGPGVRYGETIVNAYAVYAAHKIEFLNEAFLIRFHLIGASSIFNTPAFYTQFSRQLGPIRPFIRYQYLNASSNNTVYDDVGLRYGPSFGARYDLNDYVAFKAQLDRIARRALPDLNGLHLQLAFTF